MRGMFRSRFWRSRRWPVWLAGCLAVAAVMAVSVNADRTAERLNTLVFDGYQNLRPRAWAGSPVTILDIDEASLEQVGQWPWPRDVLARITQRLSDLGAAAIVFDIVFAEADRTSPGRVIERLREAGATVDLTGPTTLDRITLDNDAVLAETIAKANVVTALVLTSEGRKRPPKPKSSPSYAGTSPAAFLQDRPFAVPNLPALDAAAAGIGIINFEPDIDGVVRKAPLIYASSGENHPSLAMEALRVAQGASTMIVRSNDASGSLGASDDELGVTAVRVGAFEMPTDRKGEMRVHHSRSADKPTLSIRRMLADRIDPSDESLIAGRIVLIGTSAQGLLDLRSTPLESIVPGVTIHADIIDQVMASRFLTRPDWSVGLEQIAAIVLGLAIVAVIPFFTPLAHALFAALLMALAGATSWWGFTYAPQTESLAGISYLVSPLLPAATVFAGYASASAARLLLTEREERFVRKAFGLYLAPAMVDRLAEAPDQLTLGGEERELTILFCDIRGFTTLSEGLNPVELTSLLNDFLTPMTRALMERGATIDKYMGDAIMAFWNAPVAQADHAVEACLAMLDMRAALARLNARAAEDGRRTIDIGVGLNTGPCCVGNLGSEQRFNYSAIGDAVNVASRIEGLTKQYGLFNLVAAETIAEAILTRPKLAHLEIDRVGVVGRSEPLVIHTVLGAEREDGFAALRARHKAFLEAWRGTDAAVTRATLETAKAAAPPDLHALYEVFGHRLDRLERDGWPKDWDGVTRATSK